MNRPKLFKALRIAFSGTCVIVAVLLCALWVRSYWWVDQLNGPVPLSQVVHISSLPHKIMILRLKSRPSEFGVISTSVAAWMDAQERYSTKPLSAVPTFSVSSHVIIFPHWFATMLFATLTALPWLRWRFSLRTLLIATTLVAVVMGLIVWASR